MAEKDEEEEEELPAGVDNVWESLRRKLRGSPPLQTH